DVFAGFCLDILQSRSCPSSAQHSRRNANLSQTCCLDIVPCPCCVHAGHARQDSACLDSLDNTRKGVQARVCPTSVSNQAGRSTRAVITSLTSSKKRRSRVRSAAEVTSI